MGEKYIEYKVKIDEYTLAKAEADKLYGKVIDKITKDFMKLVEEKCKQQEFIEKIKKYCKKEIMNLKESNFYGENTAEFAYKMILKIINDFEENE